jgi:D-alanyl-lipoteichoic acid acyltransferase DltB (MBOAT superfamily)
MSLQNILIFTALILAYRFLLKKLPRGWFLLVASSLAVFWLQPSLPIRYLDFWLPVATLSLAILAWVITATPENRSLKQNLPAFLVITAIVLLVGLNRFISPTGFFAPSRPPQMTTIILVLGALAAVTWLLSLRKRNPSGLLIGGIVLLIVLLVILKFPPLTTWVSAQLRNFTGQSAALASPLDIRWLGFSYIAFRLIHTIRDRQSGRLPQVNLQEFVNYVIFFPAVTAGPIDRLERFTGDLRKLAELDSARFMDGSRRLLAGLFKKFVLADTLALIALNATNASQVDSGGWTWVLLYAFAFQIYFDFSGYTDIAIGLGIWLGIVLPENFNRPYLKPNLTQFWNNWHMTLTQWFRAYYFNPLTRALRSSKRPLPAWSILLFTQVTTMVLIGMWHGITWSFIIWGLWQGIGLFIQNRYSEWAKPRTSALTSRPGWGKAFNAMGIILTFNYLALGWVWFTVPDPALALQVIGRLFGA